MRWHTESKKIPIYTKNFNRWNHRFNHNPGHTRIKGLLKETAIETFDYAVLNY